MILFRPNDLGLSHELRHWCHRHRGYGFLQDPRKHGNKERRTIHLPDKVETERSGHVVALLAEQPVLHLWLCPGAHKARLQPLLRTKATAGVVVEATAGDTTARRTNETELPKELPSSKTQMGLHLMVLSPPIGIQSNFMRARTVVEFHDS